MADTENIGGVSVSITGDYSQLASDFDAAVALAVSKGATLAEAIQSAMAVPDTAPLTQAFGAVGDAAVSAAGQLSLFDQAAHVDYSDAAGQLNLFATEMESLGPSAAQAASGVMQLPPALQEAGEKAHEAENLFVEFGEKVSEILEHPVQQFRAMVEAMGPVAIGALAIGAAFYELGAKITELVLEEGQAARETQNLADKLNLGFEQTKQLGEMASVVGVNIDALSRASMRLAVALDDPTSAAGAKVSAALDNLGISATDSGDAMLKLLEKLAAIPDATDRIAAATTVIGRGAVQLEPLLNNYDALKQAVEDLGGQLDHDMVQKLLDANKAAGLLSIAWDHLKESLAVAFAPAVTAAMQTLTALLTDPKPLTLDQQITSLTQEIKDLKVAADGAKGSVDSFFGRSTGIEGTGTPGAGLIAERQATLDLLQSQKDGIERSKEYNAELDQSNKDQKQWAADAIAATEAYAAALYKAYGQLGISNFSSLLKGTADSSGNVTQFSGMDAFNALANTLEGPRLVQAADNLEAKLQEAFHAGAISAEEFNNDVDKIEEKITALGDGWTVVAKKFAGFDMRAEIAPLATELQSINDEMRQSGVLAGDWAVKMIAAGSSMKQFMDSTGTVFSQKLDANPLIDALKTLRITAADTGAEMTKSFSAFNAVAASDVTSLETVEVAWAKISSQVNKLAKTDLPAAIELENNYIAALQAKGAALGQIYAAEEASLTLQIKDAALRGADATEEIVQLTQLQYQTKALKDASEGLGQVYVGVRKAFDDAFSSLSKGLADAIVNGKNLGDVFINVGKQIATSILDTVIKGALLPLQDELNKTGGLFDNLAKGLTGLTKQLASSHIPGLGGSSGGVPGFGSGETATEGNALPGGSPGDFGGETGAGDTSSGGGALGSLGGVVPLAGLAVSIVSGIVQGFQLAHLSNLLGEIEVTTRGMLNVLAVNGEDSILGATIHTWQELVTMSGQLSNLHDDNVEALGRFDQLIAAVEAGGGGSGGGGGGGALSESDLLALNQVTNSLTSLAVTINSQQYANGAVNPATFAPFTAGGVGTQAYTLSQAVNPSGNGFGAIANPLNLAANALSAVAPQGAFDPNQTFAGQTESGAALGTSTGGVQFSGFTDPNVNPAIQYLINQGYKGMGPITGEEASYLRNQLHYADPTEGWQKYFQEWVPDLQALTPAGRDQMNSGFHFGPSNTATPTPANLIPGTPVNSFNSGGAMVTVNALNPSSRGVVDGIITGLRQIGVKV